MTEGPVARPVIHAAHSGDRAYLARSLETGEEAIIVTRLAIIPPAAQWANGRGDPAAAGRHSVPHTARPTEDPFRKKRKVQR